MTKISKLNFQNISARPSCFLAGNLKHWPISEARLGNFRPHIFRFQNSKCLAKERKVFPIAPTFLSKFKMGNGKDE